MSGARVIRHEDSGERTSVIYNTKQLFYITYYYILHTIILLYIIPPPRLGSSPSLKSPSLKSPSLKSPSLKSPSLKSPSRAPRSILLLRDSDSIERRTWSKSNPHPDWVFLNEGVRSLSRSRGNEHGVNASVENGILDKQSSFCVTGIAQMANKSCSFERGT
jgi:hypothetical protein